MLPTGTCYDAGMNTPPDSKPLLDKDTLALLQQPVSINVATRNSENRPTVARAAGCRIAADSNRLTIYLSSAYNQTLLDNIQANQTLAVVFSRPSTHQTVQLKGDDAQILPLNVEDQSAIRAYRESFGQELRNFGFPPAFSQAIIPPLDDKYIAICFTPERAYSQTPGPNAGKKI